MSISYIANCLKCIAYSPDAGQKEGVLHPIPKGNLPFETLHVDHVGPLERTRQGKKHILVITDAFTKFTKLYACKSVDARETLKYVESYFKNYSCPKRLVSDRGSAFTARLFEDAMVEWNVQHVLVATGTPRANGQVERFNRVITPMLAKIVTEQDRWDEALDQVELNLNNTVNKSTGDTPSKLLFGIHQRGKTEDHLREAIGREEGRRDFPVRREIAANKINSSQDYNARYFKKNHKAPRIYSPGDYVMLTNTVTTAGVNKKLLPRYKGPYLSVNV